MTKKHPVLERTLDDKQDGAGEKLGADELGHGARFVRRAKREPNESGPHLTMKQYLEAQGQSYMGKVNTDLHAKDAKGNLLPTLAERIALQGHDVAFFGEEEAKRRRKNKR